jgi:hypothetical protein
VWISGDSVWIDVIRREWLTPPTSQTRGKVRESQNHKSDDPKGARTTTRMRPDWKLTCMEAKDLPIIVD